MEPKKSLLYRQIEAQFVMAGFSVDRSGPNDKGEYVVSTWKPDKVGPTGTGTSVELAITDAWTACTKHRRAYKSRHATARANTTGRQGGHPKVTIALV